MPIVQTAADAEFGVAKQSNEATIPTVAAYASPVMSNLPQPVQSITRLDVTDAASVVGDPIKTDLHWEADVTVPAWDDMLGTLLVGLWPTDTKTGAGPTYTHTYSGLGGTTPWVTMFSDKPDTLKETFEAGQISGLGFAFSNGGGPVEVSARALGKKPTVAGYTVTTTKTLASGFFYAPTSTLKIEVDNSTPVTVDYIASGAITIDRGVASDPTADSIFPAYLSQGKISVDFTLDLVYKDYEAYRATFYGAVGGSAPSATVVYGSLEFTFLHSITAGHSLKLKIPRAAFIAEAPQPDPAGGPFHISITGYGAKPAAGEILEPVLINAVSTAF